MRRMPILKILWLALLVTSAVFTAGSFAPSVRADEDDPVKAELEKAANAAAVAKAGDLLRNPQSPVIGNTKADTTIVIFTDYQCPYCKAAEPRVLQLTKDDPGVKVVIKEFPILGPASVVATKAALAAVKQGKYEAFHNALMAFRGTLTEDVIFSTAKTVGLDVERLKKDMITPEITDQIIDNYNLARAMKISVTPGYMVNSHVLSGVSAKTMTSQINFPREVAAARAAGK